MIDFQFVFQALPHSRSGSVGKRPAISLRHQLFERLEAQHPGERGIPHQQLPRCADSVDSDWTVRQQVFELSAVLRGQGLPHPRPGASPARCGEEIPECFLLEAGCWYQEDVAVGCSLGVVSNLCIGRLGRQLYQKVINITQVVMVLPNLKD